MKTNKFKMIVVTLLAGSLIGGCAKEKPKAPLPASFSQPHVHTDAIDKEHQAIAGKLINDGLMYLLEQRQEDGSWNLKGADVKPSITAMVLKALLQHPDFDTTSSTVKRGFEVLLSYRQEDGGIYNPQAGYTNYTASLALMALAAAEDPQYSAAARELIYFLKGQQIVEGDVSPKGQKIDKDRVWIGGTSYGEHNRPDGSNAGMWAQALHDAGVSADDPAMQRMVGFFSRLQNRSESNSALWAKAGPNDGGFIYAWGESKAGAGPGGKGLRSYGSLTYMGFKSLLYAGLSKKDPRVIAAYNWIRRHWTLEQNPNMPVENNRQGLYYYYHTFAKALRAWGEPIITDTKGSEHNWRHELIDALAKRVREDGSWINNADRWNEGDPVLVTAYSVLALQEALKK